MLYQGLARTYPGAVRIQLALARCLLDEAEAPMVSGVSALDKRDAAAALACCEKSLELFLPLLRRAPEDCALAANVVEGLQLRAFLLIESGRRVEALSAVERAASIMAALKRAPGSLHYNFACLCLLLESPDDRAAREQRAIELLRKAISAGFRNARHMQNDPDLAPLRERADFQALIMDISFPTDPFRY